MVEAISEKVWIGQNKMPIQYFYYSMHTKESILCSINCAESGVVEMLRCSELFDIKSSTCCFFFKVRVFQEA